LHGFLHVERDEHRGDARALHAIAPRIFDLAARTVDLDRVALAAIDHARAARSRTGRLDHDRDVALEHRRERSSHLACVGACAVGHLNVQLSLRADDASLRQQYLR
jgi:hypothetical protein